MALRIDGLERPTANFGAKAQLATRATQRRKPEGLEIRELLKGGQLATSVRWRFGEYEVEVVGDEAFIEKHLSRFEAKLQEKGDQHETRKEPQLKVGNRFNTNLSPAEFYRKMRPKGGVESLVTLGKYIHDFRNQPNFSKGDIRSLAGEIRIKEIHPQYYSLALQRGLLRELDGGLAVTLSGDELLEKMREGKRTDES
jgi:hypothetical protein